MPSGHSYRQTQVSGGESEVAARPDDKEGSLPRAMTKPVIAAKPSTLTLAKEHPLEHSPRQVAVPSLGRRAGQRDVVTESTSRPVAANKPRANSSPADRATADLPTRARKLTPTPGADASQVKRISVAAGANTTRLPSSSESPTSCNRSSADLLQETDILSQLREQAKRNNYYGILHVGPSATQTELAQARRELTVQLHPDHFTSDPEQQRWAHDQLVLVNQAYTDVLHNETNRQLYDQLCKFREVREFEKSSR